MVSSISLQVDGTSESVSICFVKVTVSPEMEWCTDHHSMQVVELIEKQRVFE
jgi:hypothetical protein